MEIVETAGRNQWVFARPFSMYIHLVSLTWLKIGTENKITNLYECKVRHQLNKIFLHLDKYHYMYNRVSSSQPSLWNYLPGAL